MDEIKIGQLLIRTVSLEEEGVFIDAKNQEQMENHINSF